MTRRTGADPSMAMSVARVAAALVAAVGALRSASAVPYETFIDIEDEADLQDLLDAHSIGQDAFDELRELLHSGVDLDAADRTRLYALPNLTYEDVDRIIAHREARGAIGDPDGLISSGVVAQDKGVALAAFVSAHGESGATALHGRIALHTRWTVLDRGAPPTALEARLGMLGHVTVGLAAVIARLEPGDPRYDPGRDALIIAPPSTSVRVPKLYVQWEDERLAAIAGSFRAGFGQKLVFDNTLYAASNGLYADEEVFAPPALTRACRSAAAAGEAPCSRGAQYISPDWTHRTGLFGLGLGVKRLVLGAGWLQAYAWASAASRAVYQYELYRPSAQCRDPHDDRDPACAAPEVLVALADGGVTPAAFQTLPNAFREQVVGGSAAYFFDRRTAIGATAFAATATSRIAGVALDFQEWSTWLTGRAFGAAGIHGALGRGAYDVAAELAYSRDRLPSRGAITGGGGPAGVVRVTRSGQRQELEASLRYYATSYANPFARPISQPDALDGQRARDELGARARYYLGGERLTLRASVDVWVPPSTLRRGGRPEPALDSYARIDGRANGRVRLGLWLRYQDRDLAGGGPCLDTTADDMTTGAPVACGGQRLATIGRAELTVTEELAFTAQLDHQLVRERASAPLRHDAAAWAVAMWRPSPGIRLRASVHYLDAAVGQPAYLETSLTGALDAGLSLREADLLRLRIETKAWLDQRPSTAERAVNPELQVSLGYEAHL